MGNSKRRRRTTTISPPLSQENATFSTTTEDSSADTSLSLNYIKYFVKNFTKGRVDEESIYKRVREELYTTWDEDELQERSKIENSKNTESAVNKYNKPIYNWTPKGIRSRFDNDDTISDSRDEIASLAEDHSLDTYKGHGYEHVYIPSKNQDSPQYPRNWHPVHTPKDPMISFWPVGILIMAVFIVGIVSIFLCKAVGTRPRDPRRAVLALPRPNRARRTPRSRRRSNASDEEGGFTDENRRRRDLHGVGSSDPPRSATPPPPYPGSPPGATVYVNPLDAKTEGENGSGSSDLNSSRASAPVSEELPPPYPGI